MEHAAKLSSTVCFPLVSSGDKGEEGGGGEPRRADKVPSSALSQQHPALWTEEDPAFGGWVTWITGIVVVWIIMNSQNLSRPTSRHLLSPYPKSFSALWLSRKEQPGLGFWRGRAAEEWGTSILAIPISRHCRLFLDLFVFPRRCRRRLALWAQVLHSPHSCRVNWVRCGPEALAPLSKQLGCQWILNASGAQTGYPLLKCH